MRKLSLSLVVCAFAAFSFSQVKLGSPAQTIKSLVTAVESGNVNNAAKCVRNAKPGEYAKRSISSIPSQGMKISAVVQKPRVNGNKAVAQVAVTMKSQNRSSMSVNESVELVKVGNSWLIVAPKSMPRTEFVNAVAFMLASGNQNPSRPDPSDKTSKCMMNAKQLALGSLMYAADNDEVYKFKASEWSDAVMPYIKNKALMTCPMDKPGTHSYSFNPAILGKNISVIANPALTVMLYEGKDKKLVFRHDNKAVVAFADGHVKLVSKEDAKNLVWKP